MEKNQVPRGIPSWSPLGASKSRFLDPKMVGFGPQNGRFLDFKLDVCKIFYIDLKSIFGKISHGFFIDLYYTLERFWSDLKSSFQSPCPRESRPRSGGERVSSAVFLVVFR